MAVNRRLLTVLAPTSQLNFKTDHLWLRVQSEFCMKKSHDKHDVHVRAIQADVMQYVVEGNVGWSLDEFGRGIGRHFAEKFQDPTLVKPDLPGRYCRTTLVEDNNKKWQVVELCERLDGLIQLDAEFYGLAGKRNIITI